MIIDPLFYAMAIPSVILIGLSKGGLTGLGVLAVPLMAIVASPMQAAAVLMPILLILDLVAVWTYRKSYDKITLLITIPTSIIGIIIGAILVSQVNPDWIRIIIGFIAISFTISHWRNTKEKQPRGHSIVRGTIWGKHHRLYKLCYIDGRTPIPNVSFTSQTDQRTYAGTFMIFSG